MSLFVAFVALSPAAPEFRKPSLTRRRIWGSYWRMRSFVIAAIGVAALGFVVARARSVRGRAHAPKATASMHAQARVDALQAFQDVVHALPTGNELRILLAVALHETTFGYGWKGEGAGSYNMGAVDADPSWTGESFAGRDTHPTATGGTKPYDVRFRKYPSALEGWKDLVRELYLRRSSVRAAALTGNVLSVAKAMRATKYYEGSGKTQDERIRGYAQVLADMLWEIDRNGG